MAIKIAIVVLISALALAFAHAQPQPSNKPVKSTKAAVEPLHYRSVSCDVTALGPGPEISNFIRDYLVYPDRHSTRYSFFADPDCRSPLFTFQLSGRSVDRGPSAVVSGARSVDAYFDRVLLTVENRAALPLIAGCGRRAWEVGVQQDITKTGCLFLKPRASCGLDHDLLQIDDKSMVPGFRTLNMCKPEGRPTRLQSAPAIRVP